MFLEREMVNEGKRLVFCFFFFFAVAFCLRENQRRGSFNEMSPRAGSGGRVEFRLALW